jgi:Fibronectin type III domain
MRNSLAFAATISGVLCFAAVAHAQVPSAPTGFEAHPTSNSGTPPISLTWDPTPDATGYIIYRSTTANRETQYATSTINSYLDSSVVKGPPTVYYYRVAAVNVSGTGPKSVESATPTPLPTSPGNGKQPGIPLGGGAYRWNCEYALLGNFDWFPTLSAWFPENLHSSGAISPRQFVVDMAYASQSTMSFLNVNVPTSGLYNINWRYTFASGLFPGVTNREMSLIVNGVDFTDHERFPITGSFEGNYQHSVLQAHLKAGVNSIVLASVSNHGVPRVDTLTVSPASGSVPRGPTNLNAIPDNGQVHLWWSEASGASSYNIYRGPQSDGESLTPIATVSSGTTTYTDTGLRNGRRYFYNIAAVNSVGIGPDSNEVSATPSTNLALNQPVAASSETR